MPQKKNVRLGASHGSPAFKGDRAALVRTVDGVTLSGDIIPPCFSDPDLESGQCNPHVPLRPGEVVLCALHKSCLAAKMLAARLPLKPKDLIGKTYDDVLLTADALFEGEHPKVAESTVNTDREQLRGFLFSLSLQPATNPFRLHSIRWHIFEALSKEWVTLSDLRTQLRLLKVSERRLEAALAYVTTLTTQETYGYRIVEVYGKYRCYSR